VRFGTDGVRGVANTELTPEFALAMGRAAALVFPGKTIYIGGDTRRSGSMLTAAFSAGAASQGAEVIDIGIAPTPAIAFAAALHDAVGAVVSASHNPAADNGIKLFAPGGLKLSDTAEDAVEAALDAVRSDTAPERGVGAAVGSVRSDDSPVLDYLHSVTTSVGPNALDGLRVVVDTAHGAASFLAQQIFDTLGAATEVIHAAPDGLNINDQCGSTHPNALCEAVLAAGADVGFALDGDADRLIAVDANGQIVDGDQLMAIAALALDARGALKGRTLVVTVMSNLGLKLAMTAAGIEVVETGVGDRHVLAALESGGYSLGGEQSGHLIFRELTTTGDGLLAAVQIAAILASGDTDLAALADAAMHRLPQTLVNVRVHGSAASVLETLRPDIDRATEELGSVGRVLVRPSGTEPLLRIMVEAETESAAVEIAERLAAKARQAGS
jgi:phosphoglucosamine mutase